VSEELLLSVSCDAPSNREELLHLVVWSLVGVHGEEECCELAICVGEDVCDVDGLVYLNVSLCGIVAPSDAGDVLACLVSLELDVALDVVVAHVVGEPRVVAHDACCFCESEADDGLELHFVWLVVWALEIAFYTNKKSISIFYFIYYDVKKLIIATMPLLLFH